MCVWCVVCVWCSLGSGAFYWQRGDILLGSFTLTASNFDSKWTRENVSLRLYGSPTMAIWWRQFFLNHYKLNPNGELGNIFFRNGCGLLQLNHQRLHHYHCYVVQLTTLIDLHIFIVKKFLGTYSELAGNHVQWASAPRAARRVLQFLLFFSTSLIRKLGLRSS